MSLESFDPPLVKYDASGGLVDPSATNEDTTAPDHDPDGNIVPQSMPGAGPFIAFPSSSNVSSSCTANAGMAPNVRVRVAATAVRPAANASGRKAERMVTPSLPEGFPA